MSLDPLGAYSDEKIWQTLEHAHLKQFISGLEKGMEFKCSESGENLRLGHLFGLFFGMNEDFYNLNLV